MHQHRQKLETNMLKCVSAIQKTNGAGHKATMTRRKELLQRLLHCPRWKTTPSSHPPSSSRLQKIETSNSKAPQQGASLGRQRNDKIKLAEVPIIWEDPNCSPVKNSISFACGPSNSVLRCLKNFNVSVFWALEPKERTGGQETCWSEQHDGPAHGCGISASQAQLRTLHPAGADMHFVKIYPTCLMSRPPQPANNDNNKHGQRREDATPATKPARERLSGKNLEKKKHAPSWTRASY